MTRFCNRGVMPSDSRRNDMVGSDSGPVKGVRTARGRAGGLWGIAIGCCLVFCGLLLILATDAFALPPGRHYEMVSPVFKGGFGAPKIEAVASDGESVAYDSAGVFNGAPSWGFSTPAYLARRGASSWETVPLRAPASLFEQNERDLSPDLSTEFSMGSVAPNEYTEFVEQLGLWLHPTVLPDTA